jgi:hypothetical protein
MEKEMLSFTEFNQLIGLPAYNEMEKKYRVWLDGSDGIMQIKKAGGVSDLWESSGFFNYMKLFKNVLTGENFINGGQRDR